MQNIGPRGDSSSFQEFCKAYWLTGALFRLSKGSNWRLFALTLIFFSVLPTPCFWAAWIDSTLFLEQQNQGKGLMEHPAFWSLFLAGPIFVLLFFVLFRRMASILDRFCLQGSDKYAPECRDQILDLIACRTRQNKILLGSMMLLGSYAVIANYQNTKTPGAVFRQDVWDSLFHPTGFIVAKLFLIFQWMYLFPLAIYLGLATSASILLLTRKLVSRQKIDIFPFEPDGCGGYRPLGQAMLVVIYLNFPFALFVAADILTHRTFYGAIIQTIIVLLLVLIFEIFAPFLRLHNFLSAGKSKRLHELNDLIIQEEAALKAAKTSKSPSLLSVLATVELYKQTQKMHTWPYLPTDRLKWLTPLLPIMLGILKKKFMIP